MTLSARTRLGPYEILAPPGAGGMGEVYRARDTRLGREVAVKVLPASLATDTDALARFEREALAVGWDEVGVFYNAPFDRIEKEVAPHTEWLIFYGLALPRLAIRAVSAEAAGKDLWRVRAVLENTGWLPTNGSQQALDRKAVGEVVAEIALPPGASLVAGVSRKPLGQLAGRSEQRSTATWWGYRPGTPDRALAEWMVTAPAGTRLTITASHERAGTARADVVLQPKR